MISLFWATYSVFFALGVFLIALGLLPSIVKIRQKFSGWWRYRKAIRFLRKNNICPVCFNNKLVSDPSYITVHGDFIKGAYRLRSSVPRMFCSVCDTLKEELKRGAKQTNIRRAKDIISNYNQGLYI